MQDSNIINDENQSESSQPSQIIQKLQIYKIILLVEIILIVILIIANIAVKFFRSTPNNPVQTSNANVCKHRTKEEISDFLENITKDEAISIVKNLHSEAKCVPEGLLPEKFILKPYEYAQEILYSYDDVIEVPSIAQDSVMGLNDLFADSKPTDDFLIDETTEYYTIVSVDNSKVPCGELDEYQSTTTCYRGISFNRKYLDHHEKVEGTSYNDEMVFNDLSPDFVELALKIIMATDIWSNSSLYDYYFEDGGDAFVLTGIYFGIGIDMSKVEGASLYDIPYAINIYEKKLSLNKNTREATFEKYSEESSSNTLKSLPLSKDEVIDIQATIYGLSDDEIEELKKQHRDEDEMTNAEMLEARVSAICGNDYSTIFKNSEDSGIFKCNDYTKAIYSISNPDRTEENYKNMAYATFLGTDDDEIANEFFNNKLYIYQNYNHSEIPDQLILLLESSSEEALIEDNLDTIYNYIKRINEESDTDLLLYVFYTEDLSQTNDLKDYIVMTGVAGFWSWLPNGDVFKNYFYQKEKNVASIIKLSETPDLYSSQTRDAIKFHRHIKAEISNGRDITKESLRQLLYDSFENGL